MINSGDLKPGQTINVNGEIFVVLDISKNKTARSAMVVKTKVRNLRTGTNLELRFNDSDKVEAAMIEKREMQYLYDDGSSLVFMDNETYEQVEITEDKLEDTKKYLIENLEVQIDFYEGDIIGITLPEKIEYTVAETTEAVKGNTTNNAQKDATLDNGLVIKVPLFINEGEKIIVSTIDGKYSSRA